MFKKYANKDSSPELSDDLANKTKELIELYQSAGLVAEILYTPCHENNAYLRNKKVHDIKGALRTLKMATDSIADGYRFDDAVAELKISAMQKAVAAIDTELSPIISLISPK